MSETKPVLANALMEMMEEMPFEDITVTEIANRCNMNRKSFYYHFLDKYDLVCWIFDKDLQRFQMQNTDNYWDLIANICLIMQNNRNFYQKALFNQDQNCLNEHIRNIISDAIAQQMEEKMSSKMFSQLYSDSLADSLLKAIEGWLNKDNMDIFQFVDDLRLFIKQGAMAIASNIPDNNQVNLCK